MPTFRPECTGLLQAIKKTSTVQPRLSKPQLSVPSIIRTLEPNEAQSQSEGDETAVQCTHMHFQLLQTQ